MLRGVTGGDYFGVGVSGLSMHGLQGEEGLAECGGGGYYCRDGVWVRWVAVGWFRWWDSGMCGLVGEQ